MQFLLLLLVLFSIRWVTSAPRTVLLSENSFDRRWDPIFSGNLKEEWRDEAAYLSLIESSYYDHYLMNHLFFIYLRSDCEVPCHNQLSSMFPMKRYAPVSQSQAIVFTTAPSVAALVHENSKEITAFKPLHPLRKLDLKLFESFELCNLGSADSPIMIHVTIAALTKTEAIYLRSLIKTLSDKYLFTVNMESIMVDALHALLISTTCGHAKEVATSLAELPHIMWVEEKLHSTVHNRWARGICQTGVYDSTPFYSANLTGKGQLIGIADSGIDMYSCYFHDPNHDTLVSNQWNMAHRKVVYYGTTSPSGEVLGDTIDDAEAHGTHVCGIAAGKPILHYGDYAKYAGHAYDAKIAFLDIGKTKNNGSLTQLTNIDTQYLVPLYKGGVRVFSNSWGDTKPKNQVSPINSYTNEAKLIDQFMHDHSDALVVFSVGNSGGDGLKSIVSPSTNKNGICVGASLNDYLSNEAYFGEGIPEYYNPTGIANFSSRGPTSDGRLKPDILAPGYTITTANGAYPSKSQHCDVNGIIGTSMSAPAVAANALLIREYFQTGFYPAGRRGAGISFTPSGALIKAVLIHSGQNMSLVFGNGGTSTSVTGYPSFTQGYGRIKLDTVLNFGPSGTKPISLFVIGSASNTTGSLWAAIPSKKKTVSYIIQTGAYTEELRVTLAYTDTPGISGARQMLINDLDLTLRNAVTKVAYLPLPNNAYSRLDNVEMIVVKSPPPFTNFTVTVSAHALTSPQPFALVVTGHVTAFNGTDDSEEVYSAPAALDRISVNVQWVIGILSAVSCLLCLSLVSICRATRIRELFREIQEVDEWDEDVVEDAEYVEEMD